MTFNIEKSTPETIYNKVVDLCEKFQIKTIVKIVEGAKKTNAISYKLQLKRNSKILTVRVETSPDTRAELRDLILKELGLTNKDKYTISGSEFEHIKATKFIKINKIEEIRIIIKPYKEEIQQDWSNHLLDDKLKENIGKVHNQYEREVLKKINGKIGEIGKSVTLKINGKIYANVIGLCVPKGNPKADFIIINGNGKQIGYISYKKGNTAKDFQQYGGMSSKGEPKIYEQREVQKFINELTPNKTKQELEETLKKDVNQNALYSSAYKEIRTIKLKNMAVFGSNWTRSGSKKGINNVDCIAQGEVGIEYDKPNNILQIQFAKYVKNGNIDELKDEYMPVLAITKRGKDRKFEGISGYRGGIYPIGYISGRDAKQM